MTDRPYIAINAYTGERHYLTAQEAARWHDNRDPREWVIKERESDE